MSLDVYGLLTIDPATFIGETVAVLGIKGSGKSNTAEVLAESCLELGIPICILDLEGEYYTLKELHPEITIVGNSLECNVDIALTLDNARQIAVQAYMNGKSFIIDLSGEPTDTQEALVARVFNAIWDASSANRIPLVIFLEECQNWIPQNGKTSVTDLFTKIATRGRKRGLSLILMSLRSAMVDKSVLSQADVCFLHKVRHPVDLDVYKGLIPRSGKWVVEKVSKLQTGQVLLLKGEDVIQHQIRKSKVRHAGATPSIKKVPDVQLTLLELMGVK